jgi:hypothetical protein
MLSWYEYARDWLLSCPSFDSQLYSAIPETIYFIGDVVQSIWEWL